MTPDQQQARTERLTPAARAALDELLEDYRQAIVRRASERVASRGSSGEISVGDIVYSVEGLGSFANRGRTTRDRMRAILRLYVALGLLLAGTGVGWLVLTATSDATGSERTAALITVGGLAISAASAFMAFSYGSLRELRTGVGRPAPNELRGEYIRAWAEFELQAKLLLSERLGESSLERMSIGQLVPRLREAGLLSDVDAQNLRGILQVRNQLMHAEDPGDDQIMKSMNALVSILNRLQAQDLEG